MPVPPTGCRLSPRSTIHLGRGFQTLLTSLKGPVCLRTGRSAAHRSSQSRSNACCKAVVSRRSASAFAGSQTGSSRGENMNSPVLSRTSSSVLLSLEFLSRREEFSGKAASELSFLCVSVVKFLFLLGVLVVQSLSSRSSQCLCGDFLLVAADGCAKFSASSADEFILGPAMGEQKTVAYEFTVG